MQKLRTTFKRSRTPTGAEMKQQSSLEVPKQVRSASFDEIEFGKNSSSGRRLAASAGADRFLNVPSSVKSQRSKSFDSATTSSAAAGGGGGGDVSSGGSGGSSSLGGDDDPLQPPTPMLDVPRWGLRRRSSSDKSDKSEKVACVHCAYLEEYEHCVSCENERPAKRPTRLFSSCRSPSSDDEGSGPWDYNSNSEEEYDDDLSGELEDDEDEDLDAEDASDELSENDDSGGVISGGRNAGQATDIMVTLTPNSPSVEKTLPFLLHGPSDKDGASVAVVAPIGSDTPGITVVSLEVPVLPKQQRSASIDACFGSDKSQSLEVPKTQRSKSIDVTLPTDEQKSYKAVVPKSQVTKTLKHDEEKRLPQLRTHRKMVDQTGYQIYIALCAYLIGKAIQGEILIPTESGEQRTLRSSADWNEAAVNGDHLWVPTSASGDFCYVGENDCSKQGSRMKCAACKIIAHTGCVNHLLDKVKFTCKPTFRDVGVRQYREQTIIHHHWVHRRNQKGKCKRCGKSFQSKLFSGNKDIVAISCSWCKAAYHNKESCFNMQKIEEQCSLGIHAGIIVPPSWIVKLPRKGAFKSSLRKSPKKRTSTKRKLKKEGLERESQTPRAFAIKPIPTPNAKPVIVFINPRSGGNQGSKLMQKFQWLLNPRQVFDLSQGGPRAGLEMYKKVPNLRILACGGDGTVGWVLSVLDDIGISPPPAVAVLPLGTGNDLARALGWGGGYTDEPISKILCNIEDGEIVQLDRWDLKIDKCPNPDSSNCEEGKENLPLSVVNNYFSLGADAYIALEFHEAREAHPEKFNSRLKNKMFYGQAGGKDLLQRKWKDLSEHMTLECDGKDLTPKLRELKVHAVVFLNIPSYGGGTHPWNTQSSGFEGQRTDDGLIEVVGLTTYQLPLLQAGGHGTSLAQCKHARLITKKTIPMQVDGEPCKLGPSIIELKLHNQANMVAKSKVGTRQNTQPPLERLRVQVSRIGMADYENNHYDKERLRQASIPIGIIIVDQDADLEQVRIHINRLQMDTASAANSNGCAQKLSPDWCFLDSCTAERFFRIDRAQEHLHYVTDISSEDLFILDPDLIPPFRHVGPVSTVVTTFSAPPETLEMPSIEMTRHEDQPPEMKEDEIFLPVVEVPSKLLDDMGAIALETPPPAKKLVSAAVMQDNSSTGSEPCTEEIVRAGRIGDLKLLKELHASGNSLLSVDSLGMTALHFAARFGNKDIVRYLIASAPPAILNMVDNEKGQTALHKAAAYKRRTICCMLVAAGASLTVTDNQGLTPRQQALKADDKELAAYLESQEHFQLVVSEDQETAV